MAQHLNSVIVALDGTVAGTLVAWERGYRFSYFEEYAATTGAIPLSVSYPFGKEPEDYSFAGALPPYFDHLLPEGWLSTIADTARLPMNTPLEKLATLCRDNLGAVEIYGPLPNLNLTYEKAVSFVRMSQTPKDDSTRLFTAEGRGTKQPQWRHCLRCLEELPRKGFNANFHEPCSESMFGSKNPPILNVSSDTLADIARAQLRHRESLTGVQPKFSAVFKKNRDSLSDSVFIVKPEPTFVRERDGVHYQYSAVAELITMRFVEILGLPVAETALVYLQDGQPAVISKRFDRSAGKKVHTEDMAQALSARYKYTSSYEKIASVLKRIPDNKRRQDTLKDFLKIILLNFIIGNSDSHLKNFSLIHSAANAFNLSPIYDVLPIRMFALQDTDQLGLTVDGKKSRLKLDDFIRMTVKFGLNTRLVEEFVAEIAINLDDYHEAFGWFGVPEEFVAKLRTYCHERLADLSVVI